MDENSVARTVDLDHGQGYLLRGSTTYHRVLNNENEDDERLMLGFHFTEAPRKVTKNLCYFATLTKWRVFPALSVILNQRKY
jgi:hypothetical protein